MFGKDRVVDFRGEMLSERFGYGEDDFTGLGYNGVSVDEVKESVGIAFLIGIETVEVHYL